MGSIEGPFVRVGPRAVLTFVVTLCGLYGLARGEYPYDLGGLIRGTRTLPVLDRPYEVRSDVLVQADSTLRIQPGVEIRFAPGTGIIVKKDGTLIAEGEPHRRIVLTRLPPPGYYAPDEGVSSWPAVRLVDGESILEGRLQMFYNGKWRSVCTNSRNWTEYDLEVMCRQLGFSGGEQYHWFPRNNDTSQMLYERPECSGFESSLSTCSNWRSREIGSGVCDFHHDIGIRCKGNIGNHSIYHWRGVQFLEAKTEMLKPNQNRIVRWESLSVMKHVDVLYAGSDGSGFAVPAVDVVGMPPRIDYMDVKFSAFDGVHLQRLRDAYTLNNSVIAENRGYGLFINSSVSQVSVSGSAIRDNGGGGIKFLHHEYFVPDLPFCSTGNIGAQQTYPVRRSISQTKGQYYNRMCEQMFEVGFGTGQVLTVNFLGLTSDAEEEQYAAYMDVYDGSSESSRLLGSVPILNNTFPQSLTSTKHEIFLRYRPAKNNKFADFTIEIVAGNGRAYDLNITDCTIAGNSGYGVVVQNQRSGVVVNRTLIIANDYIAGLHVSGGSGDVLVNNSNISTNNGDGVNITTAGGYLHIDRTFIFNNTRRGIAFWLNESSTSIAFNHSAHITRTAIAQNGLYGLFVSNQCRSDSFWNISMNSFRNNMHTAIVFYSCFHTGIDVGQAVVFVTHNNFTESKYLALDFSPVHNMHLLIEHNVFHRLKRGAIHIKPSEDDDRFMNIPARVEIMFNYFVNNSGANIVNIGMFGESSIQKLIFTKNHLVDNIALEPFSTLNPRSRAAAVVVVSSKNTDVYRNALINPLSKYELASHLTDHNAVINATYNYLGKRMSKDVYERIFDCKDRYSLACVGFLPFLLQVSDLDSTSAVSEVNERDNIILFKNGLNIGGDISGYEELGPGEYTVLRDIYVRPNAKLLVHAGAILKFDQSVGMMVQGTLLSEGSSENTPVVYTLLDDTQIRRGSSSKLRLSNGNEGRLEISMRGVWGSVCYYGWDIVDASIACHQMGLVLHPEDWMLEQSQFSHSPDQRIIASNLQCTELDTDITECTMERDFENSCSMVVGLKCHKPSWAGLRLGMAAKESRLKNVVVKKAGLLDYSSNQFKPALQIDFNRHHLESIVLQDNIDSGLGIMWNEMFLPENRLIIDSDISSNQRHGIVTHAQGINVVRCNIERNGGSGIHYNPMFTKTEQKDLVNWVDLQPSTSVKIPDFVLNSRVLSLSGGERRYLVFTKAVAKVEFRIVTGPGRRLGIMVINPFSETSTEKLTIYERFEKRDNVLNWDLRKNLTSFPLRTPGYGVLVEYDSGANPSGKGILYISSVEGQVSNIPVQESHPSLKIDSVSIRDCKRGFSSHHYNRDISIYGDHFHRYSNETILITNTSITGSKAEAVFVWTPFWDPIVKPLAEVNYTIIKSEVNDNARGLLHYSRDIRSSNNLFHWTINDTVINNNNNGGIDIRFPYVWQYSENYTHSFVLNNCTLSHNRNFEFSVGGHFARVNILRNTFKENTCRKGVISISGMEKEMLIIDNFIMDNYATFAVEFNIRSHADKFGLVPAEFYRNAVVRNKDVNLQTKFGYQPSSYAVGIRGVQKVNVTRNLLENINLQFEFLGGVLTGSLDNFLKVEANWWGTTDVAKIRKRIFDFDDWNGFSVANFTTYLAEPDRYGKILNAEFREELSYVDDTLQGRIFYSVRLRQRSTPYVVSSDVTVMPNAVLTIDPGVVIEFYPSVGILALGDIVAQGRYDKPIIMRPFRIVDDSSFDATTALETKSTDDASCRLCASKKCDQKVDAGFLEIFNQTTEQWVPVCDPRFTERNAQVVCNELGFDDMNVHVQRGPWLELGPTEMSIIRSWPHPLECIGNEKSLSDCEYRLNGYVDDYRCQHTDDFVYVYCGPNILTKNFDHWGGIRFSVKSFESTSLNRPTISYSPTTTSKLEYVSIEGAGILHGEKSGAIQMVQRDVHLDFVNVTKSASNGIEVIAAAGSLSFNELVVKENLGVGLSFLSLTGESSYNPRLSYDPLLEIDMPYSVFGLVNMCDINKEMVIKNRLLLYYKYDNQPVDCVKIFSSYHNEKQIGFRLLQFNLFNGTGFAAYPDSITIHDGDIFNDTVPELGQISWQTGYESNATKFYVSSGSTLSVHLHTIGGSGKNGFIAEVTTSISHVIDRSTKHNVSYSVIENNTREGIAYRSAGEISPAITLRYNRITGNGQKLYGNFTISDSGVLLDIQNVLHLYFHNNLLMNNQGGFHMCVDSHTSVSALKGEIVDNLFTQNYNREAFMIKGRRNGALQKVNVYKNYFARNYAEYRDTIVLSKVVSNFTENLAYNNTGRHVLLVVGFDRRSVPNQLFKRNYFWLNAATDSRDRTTVLAGQAGPRFEYNYFYNPDNDFELTAMNRSVLETKEAPIYAEHNWWGFNETTAVASRVKEYFDFDYLLEVKFKNFLKDNSSVLSGKCAAGWTKIGDTCFLYVGGPMTFAEAKHFCELDNSSLPYVKTMHKELMEFVESQQYSYYRYSDRIWIQSIDVSLRDCPVLINSKVRTQSCNDYYPFLCERDPEITVVARLWLMEPITIAFVCVSLIVLVFVAMCLFFWLCKSRQRYREKLERRNSIRASIRSNRSLTGFSELGYKRRIEKAFEPETSSKVQDLRLNASVDSIEKTPSRFSCSMDESFDNTPNDTSTVQNGHFPDFVTRYRQDPEMENRTVNMMVHPTFDLTYENHGYVDRSASRNSHEISRDWSSSTGSTLDMKRSLDHDVKDVTTFNGGPYRNIPSPHLTSSHDSNSRDCTSSCSSSRAPPLETAM